MKSHEFASLLCSRLCHDLLSPVGALNNGIELLADERDPELRARFARDYRRRVAELNAKIEHYNLIVPSRHLEQITRSIDRDLREADRRRWAAMDAEESRQRSAISDRHLSSLDADS